MRAHDSLGAFGVREPSSRLSANPKASTNPPAAAQLPPATSVGAETLLRIPSKSAALLRNRSTRSVWIGPKSRSAMAPITDLTEMGSGTDGSPRRGSVDLVGAPTKFGLCSGQSLDWPVHGSAKMRGSTAGGRSKVRPLHVTENVGAPTEVAGGIRAAVGGFVLAFGFALKRELGSRTPNVGAPTLAALFVAPASCRLVCLGRQKADATRSGARSSRAGGRSKVRPLHVPKSRAVGAPTFLLWSEVAG